MSVTLAQPDHSLSIDDAGVIRVGHTRVTLDTLVAAFTLGATAEQIVHNYPALDLAEVYSAIGYYLNHQREVDEYIARGEHAAADFRASAPALYPDGIRARLMSRARPSKAD